MQFPIKMKGQKICPEEMILDIRFSILDDILKDLILLIGIEYPVSSIEYHSAVEPEC